MRKIWKWATATPKARFFHGAPTRTQAKSIFWKRLKDTTKPIWKKTPNESELYVTLLNGTEIRIVGFERPEGIEGQPWWGGHITEAGNIRNFKEVFDSNIRPVLSDTNGKLIIDGVPEMGVVDYREMAKYACGGAIPSTVPYYGAYAESDEDPEWCFYTWFSADVLPAKEIESARRTLDPKLFKQEYEGSFETLEGRVYYGYTADYYPNGNLDASIKYDKNLPVFIGMDFNVNPMTCVLSHIGRKDNQPEVKIFKEYFLKDSNTESLAERIITDFPDTYSFTLTPCQSSSARQTVAEIGTTDKKIIKNVFKNAEKHLRIYKRSKNPPIKDRIASSNSLLHHNRMRIHPACKELARDWESLSWKPGTTEIDYTDKMRGHISAGLDYMTERHFPVLQGQLGQREIDFIT